MLQLPSDVAMCYGVGCATRARGSICGKSRLHRPPDDRRRVGQPIRITSTAEFDGKRHVDEAQTDRRQTPSPMAATSITCARAPPSAISLAQRGARGNRGRGSLGSPGRARILDPGGLQRRVQRAWHTAYGDGWTPPHSSIDAQYKSSKLKYALYRQVLKQVFDAVKADNAKNGRQTRCYVATHSLVNYSHWGIVSPESSLLAVGADGFIAQVWTGDGAHAQRL